MYIKYLRIYIIYGISKIRDRKSNNFATDITSYIIRNILIQRLQNENLTGKRLYFDFHSICYDPVMIQNNQLDVASAPVSQTESFRTIPRNFRGMPRSSVGRKEFPSASSGGNISTMQR